MQAVPSMTFTASTKLFLSGAAGCSLPSDRMSVLSSLFAPSSAEVLLSLKRTIASSRKKMFWDYECAA